jgi:hypothetical protein
MGVLDEGESGGEEKAFICLVNATLPQYGRAQAFTANRRYKKRRKKRLEFSLNISKHFGVARGYRRSSMSMLVYTSKDYNSKR